MGLHDIQLNGFAPNFKVPVKHQRDVLTDGGDKTIQHILTVENMVLIAGIKTVFKQKSTFTVAVNELNGEEI
jgi:hypothetical protein